MKRACYPNHVLSTALVAISLLVGSVPVNAAGTQEASTVPSPVPSGQAPVANAVSDEPTPETQSLLQRENLLYTPGEVPEYKKKIQEFCGTQWCVNLTYALWSPHHIQPKVDHTYQMLQSFALICQPIIPSRNGGTWLAAELYGACDIPRSSKSRYRDLVQGLGAAANPTRGAGRGISVDILELAIMQYMASGRVCVTAGVLDLSCQFDKVSMANNPLGNFSNDAFVNSTVLPLPECNLGCIAQIELTPSDYIEFGFSRTGCRPGYNPFRASNVKGCVALAEYAHFFTNPDTVFRVTPFLERHRYKGEGDSHRHNAGITASIEYTPNDFSEFFMRTGWAARQELGNAFELSLGTRLHFFPSRPYDYLGLAAAVIQGQAPYEETLEDGSTRPGHHHEYVMEGVYSFMLARGLKVVPHVQVILDPSYRNVPYETIWGIQASYTF